LLPKERTKNKKKPPTKKECNKKNHEYILFGGFFIGMSLSMALFALEGYNLQTEYKSSSRM